MNQLSNSNSKTNGFTLIEVLLALVVISIALTALLKATSQNTRFTQRLKEKSISHWVAMQGVTAIQLGLISPSLSQESTETTTLAGQKWYWRTRITPTSIKGMQQISIKVSQKRDADFSSPLIAFRYVP